MNFWTIIYALLAYDLSKMLSVGLFKMIGRATKYDAFQAGAIRKAELEVKIQKLQAEKNIITLMEERANG